ncbi:MAG: hypothetical protein JHC84_15230 [Solirubrobacteraceae bacterium]|nr:hypothetical protein [Solirubrobacteraceae bacterium]
MSCLLPAVALVVAATLASGCGSATVAELPPAAAPPPAPPAADAPAGEVVPLEDWTGTVPATPRPGTPVSLRDGRLTVAVLPRERAVEIRDGQTGRRLSRVSAGVGPTQVACRDTGPCYVLDTRGDGLLVLVVSDDGRDARISRRVYLRGGPSAVALDEERARIWVTAPGRNELSELPAHGRPRVLRRLPTVRGPYAVAVDAPTGAVLVTGRAAGLLQRVTP